MICGNLDAVCANVAPGDLRVIEQYAPPQSSLYPIRFFGRKSVRVEYLQGKVKQSIIFGNLRFDHPKPWFQLDWAQEVRLFELECTSLIIAASENPVSFTPLLQMLVADVACRGDPIPSRALEFEIAPGFIDGIRPNAIVVGRLQFK